MVCGRCASRYLRDVDHAHGPEPDAPKAEPRPEQDAAAASSTLHDLPRPTRRRYELHSPGILYLTITVFLAIGSINSQNNLLFIVFGLLAGGVVASGVLSGSGQHQSKAYARAWHLRAPDSNVQRHGT